MFDDLDATLKAVLDDASAPADLLAAEVSFDTPDKDFKPALATINLFLHEVSENRMLRDEARVITKTPDGYTSRLPSLRVDCTYLTTAWSAKTGGLKAAEEHRLLGQALQWLSRWPLIDERFLRGALRTPPQPFPLSTAVAQSTEGRSASEFWSALGIPPRPAFGVTVTITAEPFDEVEPFRPPHDVHLYSTPIPFAELAGRVLDSTLAPVAAASVSVVGTGVTVTSGPDGRFVVPGLPFGTYTLAVQPPGGAGEQVDVTYAPEHQFRTVVLSSP